MSVRLTIKSGLAALELRKMHCLYHGWTINLTKLKRNVRQMRSVSKTIVSTFNMYVFVNIWCIYNERCGLLNDPISQSIEKQNREDWTHKRKNTNQTYEDNVLSDTQEGWVSSVPHVAPMARDPSRQYRKLLSMSGEFHERNTNQTWIVLVFVDEIMITHITHYYFHIIAISSYTLALFRMSKFLFFLNSILNSWIFFG